MRTNQSIWQHAAPDRYSDAVDRARLDTFRGLITGLAISQVFWLGLGLALFLLGHG